MYKIPVSVLVVIYTTDREILLLERSRQSGHWQSVTGSMEPGESLVETAVREVGEETGLVISAGDLMPWNLVNNFRITLTPERFKPGTTHNEEHVFSLCLTHKRNILLSPAEHRDFQWLPQKEAAATCFSWSNRDAISMLWLGEARLSEGCFA